MAQINHNISEPNDGLGEKLRQAFSNQNDMNSELYQNKVDKVTGKGLSENDFTDELKTKLENLPESFEVTQNLDDVTTGAGNNVTKNDIIIEDTVDDLKIHLSKTDGVKVSKENNSATVNDTELSVTNTTNPLNVIESKYKNDRIVKTEGNNKVEIIHPVPTGPEGRIIFKDVGDEEKEVAYVDDIQSNTIVAVGTITKSGLEFTFSIGFSWLISGVTYANASAVARTIVAASAGYYRIDVAYANASNTILIQQGAEAADVAVKPVIPTDCVEICTFNIFGGIVSISGGLQDLQSVLDKGRLAVLENADGDVTIAELGQSSIYSVPGIYFSVSNSDGEIFSDFSLKKAETQDMTSDSSGAFSESTLTFKTPTEYKIQINKGDNLSGDGTSLTFKMPTPIIEAGQTKFIEYIPNPKTVEGTYYLATLDDIPIVNNHFLGKYSTLLALETAHPTASPGDYGQVDAGSGSDVINYNWDDEEGWVAGSAGSGATDTDALPEGASNLYFTNARAVAALASALLAKQNVSPNDNKTYSLKNGGLVDTTDLLNLPFNVRNAFVSLFQYNTTVTNIIFSTNANNSNNECQWMPFQVGRSIEIDSFSIINNALNASAGANSITLYIFDNSNDGLPGVKVHQQISSLGALDTAQTVIDFNNNIVLPRGNYWIGLHIRGLNTGGANPTFVGSNSVGVPSIQPGALSYTNNNNYKLITIGATADITNNPIVQSNQSSTISYPIVYIKSILI